MSSSSQLFGEVHAFESKNRSFESNQTDSLALTTQFQKYSSKYQSRHHSKSYDHLDNRSLFCRYCRYKGYMIEDCLKK